MRVRQCGAGRSRTICGPRLIGRSSVYCVARWRPTRIDMLLRVTPGLAQELCNNDASSGPPSTHFGGHALKPDAPLSRLRYVHEKAQKAALIAWIALCSR